MVPTLNFLLEKNLMNIGTIGEMKYDILTLLLLCSIMPILLICLLLWKWNEDPKQK